MLIRSRRGWELPDSAATPEDVFLSRRSLLKAAVAAPKLPCTLLVASAWTGLIPGTISSTGSCSRPPPPTTAPAAPARPASSAAWRT